MSEDRDTGIRCFIGAFLSEASALALRRHLDHIASSVLGARAKPAGGARGRWVPPANYHVTLKFLGPVAERDLMGLLSLVAALEGHPATGVITGFTGFPRLDLATLVAAELAPQPDLTRWHGTLEAVLGPEQRGFRPHVTVLRYRRPRPLVSAELAPPLTIGLQTPRLYRSDQTTDGVRYTPVSPE